MTVEGIKKLQWLIAYKWQSEDKANQVIYHVLGLSVMKLAMADPSKLEGTL